MDFSDHPNDPEGSTILKGPAEGGSDIDWSAASVQNDPAASLGPPGPMSGSRPPADEATIPGLPTAKPKGKAKLAATPPPSDVDIGPESVVLDWVAGTSEMSAQGLLSTVSG